ncbi:Uma2 family endonuclease [Saccharopolyspora dendranthemae]|uniref:Uma2 family endonuclease n=1 Tax=Saccharopolyspora dendranthemae TaxID=1181886 RepID=A0A561U2Y0_9PSEU|nr:Uma2 family endonuclease [Saccharopolyspora dendranthemae]TWF93713.1 Uma2 family endonuclease [Saccharopolyspora dendranthemae]
MSVMAETTGPHGIVQSRPFTVHDLEAMPDDGHRYELLDGALLETPASGYKHQKVILRLGALLDAACPDELEVLPAPFAVRPSVTVELQPDLLVARDEDLTEAYLPAAPVLAVEVLSPSTRLNDLNSKKAFYERLGVPCYWVIDPLEPRLTAFELGEDGEYERIVKVAGTEVFDAANPFAVRVVPAELIGRRRKA